jgi:hypothetical protein
VWPLDEGAACPLYVRTVDQGAADGGQVEEMALVVQRPASPSCGVCEPITISVQVEEGYDGLESV